MTTQGGNMTDEMDGVQGQGASLVPGAEKPDDTAIMASVRRFGGGATYAIKNGLRMAGYNVETPWVLRQMKRLERAGLVVRVPTSYAVMIVWRAPELHPSSDNLAQKDGGK